MVHRVTRDEFYDCIGERIVTAVAGRVYPYCTEYRLMSGQMVGYIQDSFNDGIVESRYYLSNSMAS